MKVYRKPTETLDAIQFNTTEKVVNEIEDTFSVIVVTRLRNGNPDCILLDRYGATIGHLQEKDWVVKGSEKTSKIEILPNEAFEDTYFTLIPRKGCFFSRKKNTPSF